MLVIEPPSGLPVAFTDLPPQLGIDEGESAWITGLITAATDMVETATNRPILPRLVEIPTPDRAWTEFWLPCAPVIEIEGAEGATLVRGFFEPRVVRGTFRDDSIRARVGYPEGIAPPAQLRQAIIMLVLEWREAGISVGDAYAAPALSFGIQRLIKQVRYRAPLEYR